MSEIFGKYCSLQAQEIYFTEIFNLPENCWWMTFMGQKYTVHVSSTKLKDICEKNSDIYMLAQSTDNFPLFV